jgi:DNA-binding transcriptional LysR family regulator
MWGLAAGCAAPVAEGREFEHYYFTLEAAIAGLGICIAPWHLVIDDIRSGRLIAPLGFSASTYRYVARRSRKQDKKLDLFCHWLQSLAALSPLPGDKLE